MPFEAHLSLYERQEIEMMDQLLFMDFDENTDFDINGTNQKGKPFGLD